MTQWKGPWWLPRLGFVPLTLSILGGHLNRAQEAELDGLPQASTIMCYSSGFCVWDAFWHFLLCFFQMGMGGGSCITALMPQSLMGPSLLFKEHGSAMAPPWLQSLLCWDVHQRSSLCPRSQIVPRQDMKGLINLMLAWLPSICFKINQKHGAGEMALQSKCLLHKCEHLSLIPRIHILKSQVW